MQMAQKNESPVSQEFRCSIKTSHDMVDMYLQFFEEIDRQELWLVGPISIQKGHRFSTFSAMVLSRVFN